jgi:hypothetical protein
MASIAVIADPGGFQGAHSGGEVRNAKDMVLDGRLSTLTGCGRGAGRAIRSNSKRLARLGKARQPSHLVAAI